MLVSNESQDGLGSITSVSRNRQTLCIIGYRARRFEHHIVKSPGRMLEENQNIDIYTLGYAL